jgi:hypothetical protein
VVGFLPPFLKHGNLDFLFIASHLEVDDPFLYSLGCRVLKFYRKMTSLPIDSLIRCHTDRHFEGCSVHPQSVTKLTPLVFVNLIHHLLKDILALLI